MNRICLEEGGRGIRCNAISPGMIATPAHAEAYNNAALREAREAMVPAARIGWLTPAAYAAKFTPQQDQGAALANGSAPWPVASPDKMEKINRQTQVPAG